MYSQGGVTHRAKKCYNDSRDKKQIKNGKKNVQFKAKNCQTYFS